jgi:hypothetical protein
MIANGTALAIDYGIKPRDNGRFEIIWKTARTTGEVDQIARLRMAIVANPAPRDQWRPEPCSRDRRTVERRAITTNSSGKNCTSGSISAARAQAGRGRGTAVAFLSDVGGVLAALFQRAHDDGQRQLQRLALRGRLAR